MHVTDRSKTVVMLIDWDNLQICHSRDAPGTELDLQALIALAQTYGTLVSARAYAEWNLLSERLAVYKAGIEPVFAPVMRPEGSPREGKSLADTVMVADGVDLLWTVAPDVFVLATSDKDMIPLARIAKQRGAAVVVLGSDLTAIPLVEMSNVFITYRQLLRELDRVSELEAPVGRAPARERRLRESRRPSSEPYSGGLGSGALSGGPIGAGGRTSSRPVGIAPQAAPAMPLPSPRSPRRRFDETAPPAAPVEAERALPAAIAPAPLAAEPAADEVGIGAGDMGPRRRRRRGGRGRRTGLGGVSDADLQAGALQESLDDSDEGDGTELDRSTPSSAAASPDDIDSAVLQLLASRDRATVPDTEEESPAETAVAPDLSAPVPATPVAEPARTPARRVARTSFSSFGPPDVPVRPLVPASAPERTEIPSDTASASASDRDEAMATGASPTHDSVTQGLAPDAVVSEAMPVEPVDDAAFPQLAPVAAAETDEVSGDAQPVTATAASDSGRPARSGRSTRSGATRRTRRPASASPEASGPSAETQSGSAGATADAVPEAGDVAARAPRRRRVRRPAGAASGAAGEAVTSEAGA